MTMIDENECIVFGPRKKACPSWPVRIANLQGLWRYVGRLKYTDDDLTGMVHVEVIGPYFPANPSRNGGRSRIFNLDQVKFAGRTAKPIDVINVEATALSRRAQRR